MLGIVAGIGAALTTVCTAIVGVATTVGGIIARGAMAIVQHLPTVMRGLEIIDNIARVVVLIGKLLGINPEDEKVDELGAKTMQEGTRPRLPQETTEEYLNYLRNEVQLDREKFDKLSDEDKLACGAIGVRMVADAIEEKTDMMLSSEFLVSVGKSKMDYTEVKMFMDKFKQEGMMSLDCVSQYLSNNLDPKELPKVDSIMVASLKELNPGLSTEEIRDRIITMKQENNK